MKNVANRKTTGIPNKLYKEKPVIAKAGNYCKTLNRETGTKEGNKQIAMHSR